MGNNSFFPTTEAEQIVWLTNYSSKLPTHSAACDIGDEKINNGLDDIRYYVRLLQHCHPAVDHYGKQATAFRRLMVSANRNEASHRQASTFPESPPVPAPGIQKRLFSHNLDTIAVANNVDHPIPEFSVAVELGAAGPRVRIDFKEYGYDGIWIENHTNGSDWGFLAIDTVKSYLDGRPLAPGNSYKTREYRLRWWDKSEFHGEWSVMQKAVLES